MTTDDPGSNDTLNSTALHPVYEWDRTTRGNVISSFFYAYTVSIFIWGPLISIFGPRYSIAACQVAAALIQFLIPWAASVGSYLVCILRAVDGLFTGVVFVGTCSLLGHWTTPSDRSKISAITGSAFWIATMATFLLSGFISDSVLGWPFVFYLGGILLLLSLLIWLIFAFDTPSSHPRISKDEFNYIFKEKLQQNEYESSRKKTPWMKIIRSKAVIGIAVYHTSYNWIYFGTLIVLPQYLKDVHSLELTENALLNCVPYFLALVAGLITGQYSSQLQQKLSLPTTLMRKFMFATFGVPSCICFIALSLWGSDIVLCISVIGINGFLLGLVTVHLYANYADLTSTFCGEISSLSNGIGTIPGYLVPLTTGLITQNKNTQSEWKYVFILSSSVMLLGTIVYCLCGSAKTQKWNKTSVTTNEDIEEDDVKSNEFGQML